MYSSRCVIQNCAEVGSESGGAEEIRTPDPHNAIVVLYQLSYDPTSGSGNDGRNLQTAVKTNSGKILRGRPTDEGVRNRREGTEVGGVR